MYLSKNIEPFLGHIDMDDFQYIPSKGKKSKNMLNKYYIKAVPEIEKKPGFLSEIYDYMGIDTHHYLFESPHRDDNIKHKFNKTYNAYYDRPIVLQSEDKKYKDKFYNKLANLDSILINEPHEYRHPDDLGNKIVYDFSNSIDFKHELRERELRLRGFRRSNLTEEDDFLSMTFCDDIDEEGTDFPCYEYGREFNYDLENRLKLAKYRDPIKHPDIKDIDYINDISANICCKR